MRPKKTIEPIMHPHPSESETLLRQLLEKPSVTPEDAGCQPIIAEQLKNAGFTIKNLSFERVDNLWATHGQGAPLIVFAGHTDVVPAGDLKHWHTPPFTPSEQNGLLYARGAADMKSGVACMTSALIDLVTRHPNHTGTLALLLTSDEEGLAIDGTQAVLNHLSAEGIKIDYAIVGEPTSNHTLGDSARNGRRGSLQLHLTVEGQGGHVAYPEHITNPNYGISALVERLSRIRWDNGNINFPPTSFQVSTLQGGDGTENVVPNTAFFKANWRFNNEHSADSLKHLATAIIEETLTPLNLRAHYQWRLSAEPFYTQNPILLQALSQAIAKHTQQRVQFNTAGGTSDARFFAKHGAETIEFGVSNATIHQANENVRIADLVPLSQIYASTIEQIWQHHQSI